MTGWVWSSMEVIPSLARSWLRSGWLVGSWGVIGLIIFLWVAVSLLFDASAAGAGAGVTDTGSGLAGAGVDAEEFGAAAWPGVDDTRFFMASSMSSSLLAGAGAAAGAGVGASGAVAGSADGSGAGTTAIGASAGLAVGAGMVPAGSWLPALIGSGATGVSSYCMGSVLVFWLTNSSIWALTVASSADVVCGSEASICVVAPAVEAVPGSVAGAAAGSGAGAGTTTSGVVIGDAAGSGVLAASVSSWAKGLLGSARGRLGNVTSAGGVTCSEVTGWDGGIAAGRDGLGYGLLACGASAVDA